jgi:CelD/BcsL family acetyltransferase involved in cellulose biosynthesis
LIVYLFWDFRQRFTCAGLARGRESPAVWSEESPVPTSVVRPAELGPAEIARWRSFQDGTPLLANPFLGPDFALAVGRHRPGARVAVLSDGQDITGFLPFERRGLGLGTPIAAGLTDLQGLVHAPGADWDPRALLKACGVSAWQFDHLVAGQKPFERYTQAEAASPVIDLTQGYDSYYRALKSRSSRFCSTLGRKGRKLGREVGELRFELDSRDVTDLRTLMAWKSDQYQRTGRLDRFSQPWIVDLVGDLLESRNEHFGGLLSMLYAGDVPVAAHFGLRYDRTLSYWFPAYSTRFNVYSPGLLHTMRLIEGVASQGVELIDLGKGYKRYKEELKSYDSTVAEGIVTRRVPLGAAHWTRSTPTAWAIRQIRAHESVFNGFDLVLRKGAALRSALTPRSQPDQTPVQPADRSHDPAVTVMTPP